MQLPFYRTKTDSLFFSLLHRRYYSILSIKFVCGFVDSSNQ